MPAGGGWGRGLGAAQGRAGPAAAAAAGAAGGSAAAAAARQRSGGPLPSPGDIMRMNQGA